MVATLAPNPVYRFFDANGAPLAGGKLYTYAAGTTTPLASYTDYSGNTANPNPVILDSTGTAKVWLGDAMYKLVLQDANGVQQWSVDNVSGSMSSGGASNPAFGTATDIPSSGFVDLGSITSHFANITGTTTINSFGNNAVLSNPIYMVKFDSSLTLTNSASLILPNSQNIVTQASDHAFVEYLGSGAWRFIGYMRADGTPLLLKDTTINGTLKVTGASVEVQGTSTNAASVSLAERTDGGTNKVTLTSPLALASDRIQTLQDATGTLALVDDLHARFLQSKNASNSASIVFDNTVITSAYRRYILEIVDAVPATDAVEAQLLMSTNNGTTYLSSYRYFFLSGSSNGAGQANGFNATGATIACSNSTAANFVGNAAGESYNAKITMNNFNGSMFKSVHIQADYTGDLGYSVLFEGTGQSNITTVVNNIQFKFSTGNIASGVFRLYGIQ